MGDSQVRQRNPFKFVTEIPELDQDVSDRVLDEQEQEEIISSLDQENERISKLYSALGVFSVSISLLLQVLAFFGIIGEANVTSRIFILLNMGLHAHIYLILQERPTVYATELTTPPFLPIQLLVLMQPLCAGLFSMDVNWVHVATPVAATFLVWICLKSIQDGKKGIEELETLKYEAKGA